MHKFLSAAALSLLVAVMIPAVAYAHVVVTPDSATVGSEITLSISIPNEKDVAVTGLKLTVPAGLKEVLPSVHPGWTVTTSGEDDNVTAITWSDGQIPVGQRDDFSFNAQMPAKATSLDWKAYQTYADGTTISWDQKPTSAEDDDATGNSGPYSVTTIKDDLAAKPAAKPATSSNSSNTLPLAASLIAIVLSFAALLKGRSKPTQP